MDKYFDPVVLRLIDILKKALPESDEEDIFWGYHFVTGALMWWNRGVELQEHAQEAAQRAYEEALRLEPSLSEAHINVGRLHHDAGRLKEAEASYRRAIRYRPELAIAYFNLGVVLEDRGRDAAAITAYEKALQRDPRLKQAHCNLGELYERQGRPTDALRHYAAAKRCGPGTE